MGIHHTTDFLPTLSNGSQSTNTDKMSPQIEHFNVLQVPINSGQPKLGVANGSHKIWEKLGPALKKAEVSYDHEQIPDLIIEKDDITEYMVDGGLNTTKNCMINGEANKRISDRIMEKLTSDSMTVTLGGDHSLALGTVHGHAEKLAENGQEIAVLWIDAHADINIPKESESGNLHGMPLGFLANGTNREEKPHRLPGHTWIKDPRVEMKNLAYIGLRDVDGYERDLLERENVMAFYMEDVRSLGIKEIMRRIYEKFQLGPNKKLHLSFDIDGMDPSIAPSTGTAVHEGLSLEEGMYIMKTAHDRGNLELVDMVEVNPDLANEADSDMTVALAALLLQVVMGVKSAVQARKEFLTQYKPKVARRARQ